MHVIQQTNSRTKEQLVRYDDALATETKRHHWDWFVSLNANTRDILKADRFLINYIASVGGLIGGPWSYCLFLCEQYSAFSQGGISPLHVHGVITAPPLHTASELRAQWRDKARTTRIATDSGSVIYRKPLVGRTDVRRYDPVKGAVPYSVAQSIGFCKTNVPSIRTLIQERQCI
jgi:hypothetical protein